MLQLSRQAHVPPTSPIRAGTATPPHSALRAADALVDSISREIGELKRRRDRGEGSFIELTVQFDEAFGELDKARAFVRELEARRR
jgi:hypothetical protein